MTGYPNNFLFRKQEIWTNPKAVIGIESAITNVRKKRGILRSFLLFEQYSSFCTSSDIIPWMGEPEGLQSRALQRVRCDWGYTCAGGIIVGLWVCFAFVWSFRFIMVTECLVWCRVKQTGWQCHISSLWSGLFSLPQTHYKRAQKVLIIYPAGIQRKEESTF